MNRIKSKSLKKTRERNLFPRFPSFFRRDYGVALGSAAGASSDDSDLDLFLSLFFELPLSLAPSSPVVLRCLPACSDVVSFELAVFGEAVAPLSP